MAGSTTTTHTAYSPTIWSADTLDYLRKKLVLAERFRRYDDQVKEFGQTLNIIPFSTSGAARDLAQGTDITFDTATETPIALAINKWKYKAHQIYKMLEVQSKYDLRSRYTQDAAYVLGDALESDIVTSLAAAVAAGVAGTGSGVSVATPALSIAAAATGLTDAKIRQAIQTLGEQNVIDWENVTLFVNPDGFNDLMAETRYSSSDFIMDTNGKPVVSGRVLVVYGVEVRVSNNVPAGTAYMAHKDSVAVAVQSNIAVKGWDNVRSGAWEQRSEMIYGTKEQRNNTAVKIAFV
jgi:hypothetical protein